MEALWDILDMRNDEVAWGDVIKAYLVGTCFGFVMMHDTTAQRDGMFL